MAPQMLPQVKRCTKCGATKLVAEFFVQKASLDGLTPLCKTCCAVRSKAYYLAHRSEQKAESGRLAAAAKAARSEAMERGLTHYVSERPCPACHVGLRFVANSTCVQCQMERQALQDRSAYSAEYRLKNADKRREYNKQFNALNPTYQADYHRRNALERRAKNKAWREAHPEKVKTYLAAYRIENNERVNAQVREWRKSNRDITNANSGKRRAAELRALPLWADLDKIKAVYVIAQRMTVDTGIPHTVDHVVPLRGKNVCGLHVHTNLQVITRVENIRKKNRF